MLVKVASRESWLPHRWHLLVVSSDDGRGRQALWYLFLKGLATSWWLCPSHLPKALPPNTTNLGIRISAYKFGAGEVKHKHLDGSSNSDVYKTESLLPSWESRIKCHSFTSFLMNLQSGGGKEKKRINFFLVRIVLTLPEIFHRFNWYLHYYNF